MYCKSSGAKCGGNGSSVGGGTDLVPDADTEDRRLDVMISRSIGPVARFGYVAGLVRGRHPERDDVICLRGSEVSKGHIRDYRMISQFRFADPPPTNQVLREAAGVLLAVKRCRRTSRAFTIFSDSSAVIGAMKKGRSSSRKLNRFLRQFCARALHRKQRFDMRFVPGIENYADGPSRGLRYPAVPPNRHE